MANPRLSDPLARTCARWPVWLALSVVAGTAGCSGSTRKDQNYGKDVGLVYEPPEGGVVSDGGRDAGATGDAAPGDATVDQMNDAAADAE